MSTVWSRDVGLETWSWSRDRSRPLFWGLGLGLPGLGLGLGLGLSGLGLGLGLGGWSWARPEVMCNRNVTCVESRKSKLASECAPLFSYLLFDRPISMFLCIITFTAVQYSNVDEWKLFVCAGVPRQQRSWSRSRSRVLVLVSTMLVLYRVIPSSWSRPPWSWSGLGLGLPGLDNISGVIISTLFSNSADDCDTVLPSLLEINYCSFRSAGSSVLFKK